VVDRLLHSARAIAWTPVPVALRIAISSGSASDRFWTDDADHEYGDISPDCRNHLVPITGATPIGTPASVGSKPELIFVQNSRSFTHGCDGALGVHIDARPVACFIQFDSLPTTPSDQVLLPPIESTQYTSTELKNAFSHAGVRGSIETVCDASDNIAAETEMGLFKNEAVAKTGVEDRNWRHDNRLRAGPLVQQRTPAFRLESPDARGIGADIF